jgi:hypothetical protein
VDRPNSKPDHATSHVISAAAKSGRWFFTAGKWHKACLLDSFYQLRCPNGQRISVKRRLSCLKRWLAYAAALQ